MKYSIIRGLIFFVLALPIGFILSALGFIAAGYEIVALELALCALVIATVIGICAAVWRGPL
jgi:hypothetical protein